MTVNDLGAVYDSCLSYAIVSAAPTL